MDIRRGIIRAFDSGTYLADVQIVGSMATMLPGVPVAKQIGADLLTSGTKCGVLFFDETNPSDACVVFVYDGVPVPWITSSLIKDGEVAVGDLAFDPATQAELDAHAALPSVHHPHPSARVYHSVAQTIPHNTWNNLAFNSERWDTDGIHDTVTNNSRLTCQTAGKYLVIANVNWESNTTGQRIVAIRYNAGGTRYGQVLQQATSFYAPNQVVSTIVEMAVGDYVEVGVFQNSGGNLDVVVNIAFSPEFMMVKVA